MIGIGIDTGGTCTDAVVYDTDIHRVLSWSKTVTTHRNLKTGILKALKELVDAGIKAYVMAEPMMSHIEGKEEEFVDAVASTGTRRMEIGPVGYRPELKARMERMHLRSASVMSIEKIKRLAVSKGFTVNDPF